MFCPNCGKEQNGSPPYCYNCGAKLVLNSSSGTMTSPHNKALEYAGFWRRFAAYLIDGILLSTAIFMVAVFIVGLVFHNDEEYGSADAPMITIIYILVITILGWLYYAFMESSTKQATFGKMALGIIVTDNEGNRISLGRATGRFFAKIISTLILLIGYIMIAFTEKKQGLHDIVAETLVVEK